MIIRDPIEGTELFRIPAGSKYRILHGGLSCLGYLQGQIQDPAGGTGLFRIPTGCKYRILQGGLGCLGYLQGANTGSCTGDWAV